MHNLIGNNLNKGGYADKAEELSECLLEWLERNNSKLCNGVNERELI